MRFAAIDPGFRNMGLALFENGRPLAAALICSEKEEETVSADILLTCTKAAERLHGLLKRWDPHVVVVEAQTLPRGMKAANMMGLTHGIVFGVAASLGLRVTWVQPKVLTGLLPPGEGKRKDLIRQAVDAELGQPLVDRLEVTKALSQHLYDATLLGFAYLKTAENPDAA